MEVLSKVWSRSFVVFYHLFWQGEMDTAREYFEWMEGRQNFQLFYKAWGSIMLGDVEKGLGYLQEQLHQGDRFVVGARVNLHRYCPPSTVRQVEQDPRWHAVLKEWGVDDGFRDELLELANELTDVTGIHVQLD